MTQPTLFTISVVIFVTARAHTQHLKVINGVSLTSFSPNNIVRIPEGRHTAYTGAIGMDYLETKWYNLSSEIGYLSIGASETANLNPGLDFRDEKKLMLHFNTTFRVFLDLDDYKLFMGAGPYLNIGFWKQYFRILQGYPYVYKIIMAEHNWNQVSHASSTGCV